MRILQVVPSLAPRTGGPATAVLESSRALRAAGIEVSVFATDIGAAASAHNAGRVTLADLPATRGLDVRLFPAIAPRRIVYSPALARALADAAPAYDLVHIHSLYLHPQFAAYRAAIGACVPYIVSPRGALDGYLRRRGRIAKAIAGAVWQRRMLQHAAGLHLTTDDEARLSIDVAPSVRRFIVPNGLRWDDYQSLPSGAEFRRRHRIAPETPIVLYFGRISHKKGLDVLIRAFGILRRESECQLIIAGPDDEGLTSQLRALTMREGVADRVTFTGMQAGAARLEALAAADVWALPSHSENFGNAVVEAMAAGLPVVISDGVNIAADVAAAGAGIVAPIDARAFANEIASLLAHPGKRRALGIRGRAFARRYDWSVVAPQLIEMYGRVISASDRREAAALCA